VSTLWCDRDLVLFIFIFQFFMSGFQDFAFLALQFLCDLADQLPISLKAFQQRLLRTKG